MKALLWFLFFAPSIRGSSAWIQPAGWKSLACDELRHRRFVSCRLPVLPFDGKGEEEQSVSGLSYFDHEESGDEGDASESPLWEAKTPGEGYGDEELNLILTDEDDDEIGKSLESKVKEEDPWHNEYQTWIRAAEKRLQNLHNKKRSLESELDKAKSVEATVQRANHITSNMYLFTPGVRSATIQNWETGEEFELVLDPSFDSASQEADALFQHARKLKRGSQKIAELLDGSAVALSTLSEILQDFSGVSVIKESTVRLLQTKLLQSSQVTGFETPSTQSTKSPSRQQRASATGRSSPPLGSPSSNVRKVFSTAGSIILIGRNRRGNEYISLALAKGNDVWMHARGTPGAHVLIPRRRGSPPVTPECLQLAANIAVFYSDARSERRADVTVASPKHIVKPRNAAVGAVQLRQEDRVVVGFPADVPEELRLARDESGQSEEYRAQDKNKNRKRSMAAASAAASSSSPGKAKSKRKRSKNA